LAARLCPDPLEELTAYSTPPGSSWLQGVGPQERERSEGSGIKGQREGRSKERMEGGMMDTPSLRFGCAHDN